MPLQTVPKGNLVSPVALNSKGDLRPLNVNADGELLVTGGGGVPETTAKARAYLSERQLDLVDDTFTKVLLDTTSFDPSSMFADNKFTIKVAGYYQVVGSILWYGPSVVATKYYAACIYKNGAIYAEYGFHSSHAFYMTCLGIDIMHLDEDDFLELYAKQKTGVSTVDIANGTAATWISLHLLSAD